jgi:hypothetical protein
MLYRIATGDKSCVHHHEFDTMRVCMQWKLSASSAHKELKVTPSAGKVMLTVFWDCQGAPLAEFQQRDHTVTSAPFCTILMTLRRKRRGLLPNGILLLHDNPRPHSANEAAAKLRSLTWEVLQHPHYSQNLATRDFYWFVPNKSLLTMTLLKEQCAHGSNSNNKNFTPQVSSDL